MLPDLQSSLLCDDVRQERNGKFILIGLFDVLNVPRYPVVLHKLCVVNRWCCGEGVFAQRSRVVRPDEKTVAMEGDNVPLRLPDSESTATSVELFFNAKFDEPGTYWIEILLDNDLKLRYPLKATLLPSSQP